MYIDKELQFADGTWAPTATGDNISTNVLDTSPLGGKPNANGGRDLGQGENLYLVITVKTAVTSAGAATVDFRLRSDTTAALTTVPVDHVGTGAIAKTALTAGAQFFIKLPSATYKKFIGVNANIGTAVLTAGAFECEIVKDIAQNTRYAGSFSLDV
jgi:hypothetical protein